jgi:16S rRNA (cytosine1402-N4)-methyltransferase
MPGEVSTRAGGLKARLTSLPRRQADTTTRQCSGADGGLAGHLGGGLAGAPRQAVSRQKRGGTMGTAAAAHLPVMRDRVLELLAPALDQPGAVLVDATLGRAGHASALLTAHPEVRLIGIDTDAAAIDESRQILAAFHDRVTLVQAVYDELPQILARAGHRAVQGVLFDLGVSSPQLDDPSRGFAYSQDAPLDMRMNQASQLTAADVLNTYPADRLAHVLREYGEERFASRIAAAVVRERAREPLTSTSRLADLVRESIPAPARRTGGNPAKRTFQALRIEVNGELEALRRALPAALDAIAVGGRIVALAYHSLEDRAVKRELAARSADTTPPGLPVSLAASRPQFRLLTRGAERPGPDELAANSRAAPARLRAAERIRAAA